MNHLRLVPLNCARGTVAVVSQLRERHCREWFIAKYQVAMIMSFTKLQFFQSVSRRSLEPSDTSRAAYCLLSAFQPVPHYDATDDILPQPPKSLACPGACLTKWAAFRLSFVAVCHQQLHSQCDYLYPRNTVMWIIKGSFPVHQSKTNPVQVIPTQRLAICLQDPVVVRDNGDLGEW